MNAGIAFREFQLGVIADRRSKPPQDDLVSTLCYAEIDGEQARRRVDRAGEPADPHRRRRDQPPRDHRRACSPCSTSPTSATCLAADPSLIETGVEELLRWVSPIKNMSRTVTRDLEMRGQQLHEGDQVMLFYPSANRDEAVFDDPDRLDVTRNPNPHLAFGFGPHFCLGASLARLELKVMFTEVLRRLPDLELATDEPLEFRPSNFISGPEAMPVRFTPTAGRGRGPVTGRLELFDPELLEHVPEQEAYNRSIMEATAAMGEVDASTPEALAWLREAMEPGGLFGMTAYDFPEVREIPGSGGAGPDPDPRPRDRAGRVPPPARRRDDRRLGGGDGRAQLGLRPGVRASPWSASTTAWRPSTPSPPGPTTARQPPAG